MPVQVNLPTVLRPHAGGERTVAVEGATVGEVLTALVAQYPGMSGQVIDDAGSLHKFVNVYLNDDDVRYLSGVDTPVGRHRRALDPPGGGRRGARRRGAPPPMTVYGSVLDLIGNTPLVDISALSPNPDVRILMKLEGQNPGGSVKDRIALAMIEAAEADGTLQPGGHADRAVVRQHRDRAGPGLPDQGLQAEGGARHQRVHRAPPAARVVGGRDHRVARGPRAPTARCAGPGPWPSEHPEWTFLYQYANPANPRAHYEGTGPGDLEGLPRGHPLRGRPRHLGHPARGRAAT